MSQGTLGAWRALLAPPRLGVCSQACFLVSMGLTCHTCESEAF